MTKPNEMPEEIWAGYNECYMMWSKEPCGEERETHYIRADLVPQAAVDVREAIKCFNQHNNPEYDDWLVPSWACETLIQAAQANAVEEVTVEEFADKMLHNVVLDGQYSTCYARAILEQYPNGIKIVRENGFQHEKSIQKEF